MAALVKDPFTGKAVLVTIKIDISLSQKETNTSSRSKQM